MVERIPLEGKKIGMLFVDEYLGNKKYLCRCECGNKREVFSSSLRKGKSHCGCLGVKFPARFIDITDKKFGKLLVIQKDNSIRRKRAYWICQCDCGNNVSVKGSNLISGQSKSCGCLNSENLTGQKFGKLLVLKDSGKRTCKTGMKIYDCQCDCGNLYLVVGKHLKENSVKSCGCLYKDKIRKDLETFIFPVYKSSAKSRGLAFDLSEEFMRKCIKNKCFYCDGEPSNLKKLPILKGEDFIRTLAYQGIDRINSEMGYIEKNCVSCCITCNRMKNNLDQQGFFLHLKKIYKNHNLEKI